MIRREENGMTPSDVVTETGGPMGYGWGASRALPAARWRQVLNPDPIMLAGGGMRAPTSGSDTAPWVSSATPPDIASGAEGGGVGTTTPEDQTVMSFFSDLFGKAFGTTTVNKSPPDSGAVVVYGDTNASGGGPSFGPIVVILLLAVVGYFGYKKFA